MSGSKPAASPWDALLRRPVPPVEPATIPPLSANVLERTLPRFEAILAYVARTPRSKTAQVASALGITAKEASNYLDRLLELGHLTKEAGRDRRNRWSAATRQARGAVKKTKKSTISKPAKTATTSKAP